MEPCLFRHGKGRGVCETVRDRPEASMEPCLFRHGKERSPAPGDPLVGVASMEPCLFRHGKDGPGRGGRRREHGFNGAMSFQTW